MQRPGNAAPSSGVGGGGGGGGDAKAGRIVVLARRERYLIISKEAIEDRRLSFRARGVHAYLMSKPDDWVVREKELLAHVAEAARGEGRDAIRAALRELKVNGYFRRVRRRVPNGKFIYITLVFESPRAQSDPQFSQPLLFESFLQSIVPKSTPGPTPHGPPSPRRHGPTPRHTTGTTTRRSRSLTQSSAPSTQHPPHPALSTNHRTADGIPAHGETRKKTIDWKTVDGQPVHGQPYTGNPTLLNNERLKTGKTEVIINRSQNKTGALRANGVHRLASDPSKVLAGGFDDDKQGQSGPPETSITRTQSPVPSPQSNPAVPSPVSSPDSVKALLTRWGMGAGRAHRLAHHPLLTAEMVDEAIEKCDFYAPRNAGAYLGGLLDSAIAGEKLRREAQHNHALDELARMRAEIEAGLEVGGLITDDELAAAASKTVFRSMAPADIRLDRAARAEVANRLLRMKWPPETSKSQNVETSKCDELAASVSERSTQHPARSPGPP